MAGSWTSAFENEAIIRSVGREAFARALVSARSGHVHDVELDDEALRVTGRVKGTHRDDYAVTVFLASALSGAVSVYRSECSCPVAVDCKHAAAVLLVARHLAASGHLAERPEWERRVDKLLTAPPTASVADPAPLALEFGVERVPAFRAYVGRQDLRVRPVRRGESGTWVRSGIGWDDLDYVARSYDAAHRELLLQLRSAAGLTRHSVPRTAWLSLAAVSTGFWRLLDEAADVGLTLLSAKPVAGPLRAASPAVAGLDLRRAPDGQLELAARVVLEGRTLDLRTVGVLGDPVHGVFFVTGEDHADEGGDLVLARLREPLSREVRQLVVDAETIRVPAADDRRFLSEFVPQLRQRLSLQSTDGSVRLPERVDPVLVLEVEHGPGHRVSLTWAVDYDLESFDVPGASTSTVTYRLGGPAERRGVRDPDREQALLAAVDLPYDAYPQLAARGRSRRPALAAVLEGPAAATFAAHVIPRIAAGPVRVRQAGEPKDYRESVGSPRLRAAGGQRSAGSDWFDLRLTVDVDGEAVPFDELFVALSRGEEFLVLESGVFFRLDRAEFSQLKELIEESRALHEPDRPVLSLNRWQVSVWDDLVGLGVEIDQSARWASQVQALGSRPDEPGEPESPPSTLAATLRPYQLEGFRWLLSLWQHGLGGILADDMGLGKTVQTLALIARTRVEDPHAPPFLVVAPTSVVSTWVTEAGRFTPDLTVLPLTATAARRRESLGDRVAGADVVVTSYAVLRIDADLLAERPWSGVVLDEAQFVKNHRAKTYAAARRIAAPFKLAITGTPLENSLMDLWALLSITAPGLFPHADRFGEYYRRPIERDQDRARLDQLRRRIRPLVLRRTKAAVAPDLPPKQEQVLDIELDPRHRRIYQTHLQRERQKVLGLLDDLDEHRFTVLRSLTLLRRLSLDPGLVDRAHDSVPAAKVEVLLQDLGELVAEGHQALVFSQFTTLLTRIRSRLDAAGLAYSYLDGRTRDRSAAVEQFRSGRAPVFLISLKAGGFGLSLAEADYCFVLDPWWNPATEAQAVDRAHRIGQDKTVMVYRMVARDTIEQKVMELKARKERLFDSVLGGDALAAGALTAEEIRGLLAG